MATKPGLPVLRVLPLEPSCTPRSPSAALLSQLWWFLFVTFLCCLFLELGAPRASPTFPSSPSEESRTELTPPATAAKVSKYCARLSAQCWKGEGGKGIWHVKAVVLPTRILQSGWEDRVCPEQAVTSYSGQHMSSAQRIMPTVSAPGVPGPVWAASSNDRRDSLLFCSTFQFMADTHKLIVISLTLPY